MFGSHISFVSWGHGGFSSVWIFGEGNEGETKLLRVASHEDLTNFYSILQGNGTHQENYELNFSLRRYYYFCFIIVMSYLEESVCWSFSVDDGERLAAV